MVRVPSGWVAIRPSLGMETVNVQPGVDHPTRFGIRRAQSAPQGLAPTHDAYVRNGSYAGVNHGTDAELRVKQGSSDGAVRDSYLKFDLSTLTSVSTAKLRLFGRISDTRAASLGVTLYSASDTAWTEPALTWNNKPASGTSLGSRTVSGTAGQWYEWDVSSFLRAEKAAGRKRRHVRDQGQRQQQPVGGVRQRRGRFEPPGVARDAVIGVISRRDRPARWAGDRRRSRGVRTRARGLLAAISPDVTGYRARSRGRFCRRDRRRPPYVDGVSHTRTRFSNLPHPRRADSLRVGMAQAVLLQRRAYPFIPGAATPPRPGIGRACHRRRPGDAGRRISRMRSRSIHLLAGRVRHRHGGGERATACPVCDGETGGLRTGIVGDDLAVSLLATVTPFVVAGGVVAFIHFGGRAGRAARRGPRPTTGPGEQRDEHGG